MARKFKQISAVDLTPEEVADESRSEYWRCHQSGVEAVQKTICQESEAPESSVVISPSSPGKKGIDGLG